MVHIPMNIARMTLRNVLLFAVAAAFLSGMTVTTIIRAFCPFFWNGGVLDDMSDGFLELHWPTGMESAPMVPSDIVFFDLARR